MFQKKIILASKSPRRSQLLQEGGFHFEVKTLPVVESYPQNLPVEDVPVFLARKKANACISLLEKNTVLLAADSVVIQGNEIFGKPKDYDDAFRILRQLSDSKHTVITGVCLKNEEQEVAFAGISTVYMDKLTDEEIDFYIQKYKPYDKAGAYAIQEWIGHCRIKRIEGTYSNIMGLPVHLVYEKLKSFNEEI